MRSISLAAALAGLAMASPVPDAGGALTNTDLSVVNAHPKPALTGPPVGVASDPPKYDSDVAEDAAAANPVHAKRALVKRDCEPQPTGFAPMTSPDTDVAFLANPDYDSIAENAPVPDGYSQTFSDLQKSVEGPGYLGFYSLDSYDTITCQAKCDAADGCYGFNMFIERDPAADPCASAPNPPSTAVYKCTLWSTQVPPESAGNAGQWRGQFHVVIAASNGYKKNAAPPAVDDFSGPLELGGAIQAPVDSYIGAKFFDVYDPSQCGAACEATTAFDHEHIVHSDGTYDACNFFNVYELSKNGVPQGMYCAMYKQPFAKSYSTNTGFSSGGDRYSVSQSYGYSLSPQDPGHV